MKYRKQFTLTEAVSSVFLSLLILLPFFAKAQDEPAPLIIPFLGWDADEESGVFDLAECLAQALGGEVLPVKMKFLSREEMEDPIRLPEVIKSKWPVIREKLEVKRLSIKHDIIEAHNHNMGRKIHIVCHSWGCTLALRVVQDLYGRIPIETMTMIDRVTLAYPLDLRPDGNPPRVPANVKRIFIVRQTWDGLRGGDVKIDDPQERVVGNFNLRGNLMNPTDEERRLLRKVRNEYKYKFDRKLERDLLHWHELHTFLDDSSVIWRLASEFIDRAHPCECINIAGTWNGSETGTFTCTVRGETETESASASGIVTIEQNGCDISVPHPSVDVVRTGTVKRNIIRISGLVSITFESAVSFTENIFNAKGQASRRKINLDGSGIAEGTATVEGGSFPFSCTANSTTELILHPSP